MKKGICYGVSVGPGDPELITIKAHRILNSADIIFLPSAPKENCKVYHIIKGAFQDIDEERIVCVDTKGMADPKVQSERYDILANEVSKLLDEGKNVAFPALGEVCLYSTYFYVHERLVNRGYECRLISGISSVQETANRLMFSLAQNDEQVHIFPDTNDFEEKVSMPGTKVFMKPKSDLEETVAKIKKYVENNSEAKAFGVSNLGTEKEIIASNVNELENLKGYMSVLIVKSH